MVIVFGSLNVDMVMLVDRIPEVGSTVLCPEYNLYPGGKGANQAVAAAKAGSHVHIFGSVGKDSFQDVLIRSLVQANVNVSGIQLHDLPTGCATICVDRLGENAITVASGANLNARSSLIQDPLLTPDSFILMQMEVPSAENWELIQRAHAQGAKTILNLAPVREIPEHILDQLSFLIVNQGEAIGLGRMLNLSFTTPINVIQQISQKYNLIGIVTLGNQGAFAADTQGYWEVKPMDIDAIDTTSAGDAFSGVFAATLDQGLTLEDALHRASIASGLACLRVGAQASLPTKEQINQALHTAPRPIKSAK